MIMKTKTTILTLLFALITNAQLILNDPFGVENFPPSGWTLQSVGSGEYTWRGFGDAINYSAVIREDKTINQNERLITPTLDLSSHSTAYLAFRPRLNKLSMVNLNLVDFYVKVSTDNGNTWDTLWDENQFDFGNLLDISRIINLDISNYTGAGMDQIKFMFQYTSIIHDFDESIAQLYFVYIDTCPRPVVTAQYPSILWTIPPSFNGTFEIEYGPVGFTQSTGTIVTGITTNNFSLPSNDCQNYDYFIRSNCGSSSSLWTPRYGTRLLSTVSATPNINSASISWFGSADNFILEYGPLNFVSGTGTTITNITGYEYELNNLMSCTDYTVRVKATCDVSNTWVTRNFLTGSENTINPATTNYLETFDSPNSLCEIGFTSTSNENIIENNTLKNVSGFPFVESRFITLEANTQYNLSVDARKESTLFDPNRLVVIRSRNYDIYKNLIFLEELTTEFENFNSTFTVPESGDYCVVIRYKDISEIPPGVVFFDNLSISNVLSNPEFIQSHVSFSPNPTSSKINFLEDVSFLEVFDVTGKRILEFDFVSKSFDFSGLESGMYIIKGKTINGSAFTDKLTKK
jgi:hypothetical protein